MFRTKIKHKSHFSEASMTKQPFAMTKQAFAMTKWGFELVKSSSCSCFNVVQ